MKAYLVAYTHEVDALSHKRVLASTSFGENFPKENMRLVDVKHSIETQTAHENVEVLAITPLHEVMNYIGEKNHITSSERGH